MVKRHFKLWVTLFALLPLLTACPRTTVPAGPGPTPADFSIDVSTSTPSFVSGSNVSVTVTVVKIGGFDNDVTLSINDPAEVTAAFDPTSTKSTSTLTLSGTTTGSYDMTVTGESGDKTKTKNITLTINEEPPPPPPATVTISGKALDSFGKPLSSAPVVILGQDAASNVLTTTSITGITNANGEFSLAGVKKPYDIVLVESATGHATMYKGLTTETPTLTSFVDMYVFYGFGLNDKKGSFNGKTNPLPAPQGDHNHKGVFGSPEATRYFSISKDGELGSASLLVPVTNDTLDTMADISAISNGVSVSWFGPTTTSGVAHALQWKKTNNNLPDVYTGYGKRDVVLADSSTTNDQDIAMTGLGSSNAGGTVTVPSGYSIINRTMSVILDEYSDITVANEGIKPILLNQESLALQGDSLNALAPAFNYRTPQITGAKVGIGVTARDTLSFTSLSRSVYLAKAGLDLSDTEISLTLPEAPALALPTNNAPNVSYDTEFIWSPSGFDESVNVVFIREVKKRLVPAGGLGLPLSGSLAIITKDTKLKLPDLSSLGITLVPPTSGQSFDYQWQVTSIGPFATVDSAATKGFADTYYNESATADVFYGDSQRFEFKVVAP